MPLLFLLALATTGLGAPAPTPPAGPLHRTAAPAAFAGRWTLDPSGTSALDPWRTIALDVRVESGAVVLVRRLSWGHRSAVDSLRAPTTGGPAAVPFPMWLGNRHLAVWAGGDGTRRVAAEWLDDGRTLAVTTTMTVETSQGPQPLRERSEYRLSPDGRRLTQIELRSSRTRPVLYAFVRSS